MIKRSLFGAALLATTIGVGARPSIVAADGATNCHISFTNSTLDPTSTTTSTISVDTTNSLPGFNDFWVWFSDGSHVSSSTTMITSTMTWPRSYWQLLDDAAGLVTTKVPVSANVLVTGTSNFQFFLCQDSITLLPNAKPDAPSNVNATAGDGQATVTFTPAHTFVGQVFTVTAAPGGATCTAVYPATSCTVSGLTNGTVYSFTVVDTTTGGTSDASEPSAEVTPVQTITPAGDASNGHLPDTGLSMNGELLAAACLAVGAVLLVASRRRRLA